MVKRRRGSRTARAAGVARQRHDRHRPFEELVERALAGIPMPYGLYEGVPRTEWGADWSALPNKISLFRFPLEADFPNPEDLEDEVRITVIHELAHHLGIDDDRLHELGFD